MKRKIVERRNPVKRLQVVSAPLNYFSSILIYFSLSLTEMSSQRNAVFCLLITLLNAFPFSIEIT